MFGVPDRPPSAPRAPSLIPRLDRTSDAYPVHKPARRRSRVGQLAGPRGARRSDPLGWAPGSGRSRLALGPSRGLRQGILVPSCTAIASGVPRNSGTCLRAVDRPIISEVRRRHAVWSLAILAIGVAACGGGSSSQTHRSSTTSTTTMTQTASGMAAFNALNGRFLPGTTNRTWSALAMLAPPPSGASEHLYATSNDQAFYVHLFDFRTAVLASDFYYHPIAVTYLPLPGPTGVAPPSRNINLLSSCSPGSSRGDPTPPPSIEAETCSVGVGTFALRSNVVIWVYWLSHIPTTTKKADSARLATVTPYVKDCLSLLASVGLPS